MSIILAAAATQSAPGEPLLVLALFVPLVLATLASPVLAMGAGVFTPGSLQQRRRLGPHESPWLLLSILLAGFGTLFAAAQVFYALLSSMDADSRKLAAGIGGEAVAFVVIVLLHRTMRHNGLRRLGLDGRRALPALPRAILGDLIIIPWIVWVMFAVHWVIQHYQLHVPTEHDIFRHWKEPSASLGFKAIALFSAIVIAPLAEEIAFRGLLQTILRHAFGSAWPAIIVTALLFGAVHGWPFVVPIFVLSLGLGWAYERTGNLWVCIFMHMLFNAVQFSLFLIGQSL